MSLRLYLFGQYMTLIIAFGLWFLLLFNVNPYQAPTWIIILFYLMLFLIFWSFFSIILYYLKVWASNREVIFAHLGPSFRQSAFLSILIVTTIFLYQIKSLNWWVIILLIFAFIFIEMFFRSKGAYHGK